MDDSLPLSCIKNMTKVGLKQQQQGLTGNWGSILESINGEIQDF